LAGWEKPVSGRRAHFGIELGNGLGPLRSKFDPQLSQAALMAAVHTTMLRYCPGLPLALGPVALVAAPDPLE
jgi:hypothetical protein